MTKFIAEVSSNHLQDLDRCVEFVKVAKDIGCDAVKFQLFRVHDLFSPEALREKPELLERIAWELPSEFIPELSSVAKELDIRLGVTPFYIEAVHELASYVDFFKIASYELLWGGLLQEVAKTGLPTILSTGMATLTEVETAVDFMRNSGCESLELLHCVSEYPCEPANANLAAIQTLRDHTGLPVGWSDHSHNLGLVRRATLLWHASSVEFHLDLDGRGPEFSPGHCWLPGEARGLISEVTKDGLLWDGAGLKKPALSEESERLWRADPADGLRPLRELRSVLGQDRER